MGKGRRSILLPLLEEWMHSEQWQCDLDACLGALPHKHLNGLHLGSWVQRNLCSEKWWDFLYVFDKRSAWSIDWSLSSDGTGRNLCQKGNGEQERELVILVGRRAGCERCGDKEVEQYAGSYALDTNTSILMYQSIWYTNRETPFLTLECGPFWAGWLFFLSFRLYFLSCGRLVDMCFS